MYPTIPLRGSFRGSEGPYNPERGGTRARARSGRSLILSGALISYFPGNPSPYKILPEVAMISALRESLGKPASTIPFEILSKRGGFFGGLEEGSCWG